MHSNTRPSSWIFTFDENVEGEPEDDESLEIPENLSVDAGVTDEQLAEFETELLATFNAIRSGTTQLTADDVAQLETISTAHARVQTEIRSREQSRAEFAATATRLAQSMGLAEGEEGDETSETEETPAAAETVTAGTEVVIPDAVTPPPATAETVTASSPAGPVVIRRPRQLQVPLSQVRRMAPDPELNPRTEALVLVAPDVPSFSAGRQLDDLTVLADAIHRRAKSLGNPSGPAVVATIKKEFDIILDREAAPEQIWDVMRRAADPANLVAAGGWCAPSTVIYDFFNIACDDGILDLPTVGISRGGIRFPSSPSIADALDDIWLWTESDDISAATGGGQKPCVRVPCPTFAEERLDCHGLCITAGNLTESAYPELIRNYLSLVMNAHRHVINQRIIADVVAQSTLVTITGSDHPITTGVLGAIDLQVADYRERYRMCDNDILEVILPRWARNAIRSDLAKRTGVDMLAVSDGQINDYFNVRSVRVQWITDWQVGAGDFPGQATPRTAWPATVEFLIMAAGTFVVGNGLDLELGVVRDSVLNAKNDHTAAWTEECKLVAKIGHDSRRVAVDFLVTGQTGAANIGAANVGAHV